MVIVKRPAEIERLKGARKWALVYGRRKTGKTFLVRHFLDYDEYFFVKKDRSIISEKGNAEIGYDAFLEVLKRALADGKLVVVDEFHRLGEGFFDTLHAMEKKGRLVLVSSTLFLSKKLFSGQSALLGLFAEVPIGLISVRDCLNALRKFTLDKKGLVELSVVLREPIAVDYFDEKKNPRKMFAVLLAGSLKTVPALVGEIFLEEERAISAVYDGIMRAVASGRIVSTGISDYLFSRKLIKKNDPSIIQQYLDNLEAFGIIKKIQVYGKNKFMYKHVSPLAAVFYYADEKYNISERAPDEKEFEKIVDELMPRIVEDSVREFLALKFGLTESVFEARDFDIDACLLRFKKPEVVVEVKWKKDIKKLDIVKAEENLHKIRAKRFLLFVPDKTGLKSDSLEIIDVSDLLAD